MAMFGLCFDLVGDATWMWVEREAKAADNGGTITSVRNLDYSPIV